MEYSKITNDFIEKVMALGFKDTNQVFNAINLSLRGPFYKIRQARFKWSEPVLGLKAVSSAKEKEANEHQEKLEEFNTIIEGAEAFIKTFEELIKAKEYRNSVKYAIPYTSAISNIDGDDDIVEKRFNLETLEGEKEVLLLKAGTSEKLRKEHSEILQKYIFDDIYEQVCKGIRVKDFCLILNNSYSLKARKSSLLSEYCRIKSITNIAAITNSDDIVKKTADSISRYDMDLARSILERENYFFWENDLDSFSADYLEHMADNLFSGVSPLTLEKSTKPYDPDDLKIYVIGSGLELGFLSSLKKMREDIKKHIVIVENCLSFSNGTLVSDILPEDRAKLFGEDMVYINSKQIIK